MNRLFPAYKPASFAKPFSGLLLLLALLVQSFSALAQPLSGPYTIGGTAPDYATFTAAAAALAGNGVSGPVVFNVRSGVYTQQLSLGPVTGASAANTITFQSEADDSTAVTLQAASTTTATNNYTLQLNGADFFIFRKLTLQRTGTNTFSTVVELLNGADNNQFLNNRIIGPAGVTAANTDGSRSGIFSPATSNEHNNQFRNNHFTGNANGMWYNGSSTGARATGTVVQGNIFESPYVGVFLLYQTNPAILENQISRSLQTSTTLEYFGISLRFIDGGVQVLKNQVTGYHGNYGIRLRDATASAAAPGLIANNFVQVGGTSPTTVRGLSLEDNSTNQNIYHNSINVTGGSATLGRTFNILGTGTAGLNVVNNNFANSAGGYVYYVPSGTFASIVTSDYNNLYTTGTNLGFWGVNITNLTNWRTTTGKDMNSVSGNPQFVSAYDLHTTAAILDGAATPLAAVTDDIDGQLRDPLTPDIGADEFSIAPPTPDVAVTIPGAASGMCANGAIFLAISVGNPGPVTVSNVPVTLSYTGPTSGMLTGTVAGPIATGQSVAFNFPGLTLSQSGTYTLTAYSTIAGDANQLNDSASTVLTVHPLPVIIASADVTICEGASATLTATGGDTYSWAPPQGLSATTGNQVIATPLATTVYTVTGTSAQGCSSTDMVTVTVAPTPAITISPASVSICEGASTTLLASGGASYSWSGGQTTAAISVSPTATTTYTVTGTSAAGCTDTAMVTVTVNPDPVIGISPASGSICAGQSISLTAQGATTYSWQSGQTTELITVSPGTTTTYTVTGSAGSGCSGLATATVTVNPLPVLAITGNTSICAGESTTLTGSGATGYSWSPSFTLPPIGSPLLTVAPAATTTYTLYGINAAGCLDSMYVTVTVSPVPTVTISPANASVCAGQSVELTATGATTYSWSTGASQAIIQVSPGAATTYTVMGSNGSCSATATANVAVDPVPVFSLGNDTTIAAGTTLTLTAQTGGVYSWQDGSAAQTFTVTQTGTYYVTVMNAAGCIASDTIVVTVLSALPETIANQILLYPNPTNGSVNLQLPVEIAAGSSLIYLTDITGRPLLQQPFRESGYLRIDLQLQPAGVYLLHLETDMGKAVKRIIKQ